MASNGAATDFVDVGAVGFTQAGNFVDEADLGGLHRHGRFWVVVHEVRHLRVVEFHDRRDTSAQAVAVCVRWVMFDPAVLVVHGAGVPQGIEMAP